MHPVLISLTLINSSILLVLSVIHFYWALGGRWGFDKALPTNMEGKRVLKPNKMESGIVGLGLFLFSFYFLIYGSIVSFELPHWLMTYVIWAITVIFLLRAIGDFKYVGFFKKIRNTEFGRLDTNFYSPLCLFLSISGIILVLF